MISFMVETWPLLSLGQTIPFFYSFKGILLNVKLCILFFSSWLHLLLFHLHFWSDSAFQEHKSLLLSFSLYQYCSVTWFSFSPSQLWMKLFVNNLWWIPKSWWAFVCSLQWIWVYILNRVGASDEYWTVICAPFIPSQFLRLN